MTHLTSPQKTLLALCITALEALQEVTLEG